MQTLLNAESIFFVKNCLVFSLNNLIIFVQNKTMKNTIITIAFMCIGSCLIGQQIVFNVDTVFAEKPATSFVIEWYAALDNDSGQNLDVNYTMTELGAFNKNWELSIDDPDTAYHIGTTIREGNFRLDTLPTTYDKLIIFLYPNNTAGEMLLKVDFTTQVDTVVQTIYYNYKSTGFGGIDNINTIEMLPSCKTDIQNNSSEVIRFSYYDLQGRELNECPVNESVIMQGKRHDGSTQCISKTFKVSN
ncbi:MAG: hypothetical protein ACJAUV_000049 [Flavobacteriales bacterium]|jgi:hypothetical protein